MRLDIARIHRVFTANWVITFFSVLAFVGLRLLGSRDWYSIQYWIPAIIQMGIALLLLFLSQTYGIIRQKSLLPAFFYLLFVGTNPLLFGNLSGSISTILVIACFFFLFATYQNSLPQIYAFNIAIFITLGSLYWFPLLFFLPLFCYGMYLLRSLNFRSFFALFLGVFVVYMFLWTSNIISENNLSVFFKRFFAFDDLQIIWTFSLGLQKRIICSFWIIFLFLSGLKIFLFDISEKIRTIMILRYLWVLSCILCVLFLTQSQWEGEWLLILYSSVSLLISYFFAPLKKKIVLWFLLVLTAGFLVLFFWSTL
ncbi:MAG: hypothetical protein Pg6B_04180 [Candidatus Azobacteroides pseudotrichonymphae]|nr:MAG: hypothetical protein Pg6B_04180 [Candidatus Azobacteroides pseudotrichonymphae]